MFYDQDRGNPRFDVAHNAAGRARNDDIRDFPAETCGAVPRRERGE
jgi:hypothetical protein